MPGFSIVTEKGCNDPGTVSSETDYRGPLYNTETSRKNRYLLEILDPLGKNDGSGILLYLDKCSRPSPEIDEMVIHNGQDEIWRPGKTHWKALEFSFYEKLSPLDPPFYNETAQKIYDWWAKTMINSLQSYINPPSVYMKDATLEMLDGDGKPVWSYEIYDCWPCKIYPDELTYKESEISKITVSLRFSKCFEFSVNAPDNNNE